MFVNRVAGVSVVVGSVFIGACGGGGGGGGSSSSNPTPSTTAFPVAQANSQMIINGYHATLTISVKVEGFNASGNGTLTVAPAVAGMFEGQAVLNNTNTLTATITANGQTVSDNSSGIDINDSNYNEIAYQDNIDGSLTKVDQVVPVPTTVHVGDSGSLGSATDYSDSTATTVTGTETLTYSIVADTATSIIFVLTKKGYDTNHNLTDTDIQRIRITDTGIGTWLSEQYTEPDGDQLTFTAQ
jgi:hypothetical protein